MVTPIGSRSKVELSWDQFFDGALTPPPVPEEPPVRRIFRETVAEVAERAKAALPAAVNGRVDKAVQIVLAGDIVPHEDGKFTVGSQSDAGLHYVVDGVCECPDSDRKELEGWCKHKIAAAIYTRATALGRDRVQAYYEPPAAVASTVFPEAPASGNVYVELAGRKVQITLRDQDETRLLARLEALLTRFPSVEAPAATASAAVPAPATPAPTCRYHGTEDMRPSKYGAGKFVCSVKLADGYCNQVWPPKAK